MPPRAATNKAKPHQHATDPSRRWLSILGKHVPSGMWIIAGPRTGTVVVYLLGYEDGAVAARSASCATNTPLWHGLLTVPLLRPKVSSSCGTGRPAVGR